jgi:hypothetical protein
VVNGDVMTCGYHSDRSNTDLCSQEEAIALHQALQNHLHDPACYAYLLESLRNLGAEELDHVNGSLIAHLEGTYQYLKDWGNRKELCLAGLYHAVYSTQIYEHCLVNPERRHRVMQLIGLEAENIVYHFAACDRDDFYPRIGSGEPVIFFNRFLQKAEILEPQLLCDLLELTMANQLEIARHSEAAKELSRKRFADLFARFKPYVSQTAFHFYQQFF